MPVLDPQALERAPVGSGLDEGQPHPRLPLQQRDAVHRPSALDVAWQGHPAEDVANGAEGPLGWFVEEGRHLGLVTGDEEEPLTRLSEAAQFSAIMGRLGDGIAIVPEERADAVEKRAAAAGDARHVFEDDQLGRVILEGFQRQPHAAQRQAVQSLVFVGEAECLRQQAGEAFARRGQEDDVRALAAGGGLDVLRGCCAPAWGRRLAVEGRILVGVEQVQHGAWHAGKAAEILDGGR